MGEDLLRPSRSIISEPGSPESNDVGPRLGRVREDARGVDQGPAVYPPFDPFLKVLIQPMEADGHRQASHFVHHEIVHAGPRNAGNVERLAVPIPRASGITDMADARFAHGSQLELHCIEGGKREGLQKCVAVGRTMEVLVGKPDMVVVLPENGRVHSSLGRVAEVGREELVIVVPTIKAIHGNSVNPAVKKAARQLIPGLRFLDDPFSVFHDELEPPLAE